MCSLTFVSGVGTYEQSPARTPDSSSGRVELLLELAWRIRLVFRIQRLRIVAKEGLPSLVFLEGLDISGKASSSKAWMTLVVMKSRDLSFQSKRATIT